MTSQSPPVIKIRPAVFPADKDSAHKLFLAYSESLPVNLDFQNFNHELSSLPGKYAPSNGGALFLAEIETPASHNEPAVRQTVGCLGLRAFKARESCELKRLYLTPDTRGLGVSKLLLEVAIVKAKELGYGEMLLDTLGSMTAARTLYGKYGFEEVGAYYESVPDAVFYRLEL